VKDVGVVAIEGGRWEIYVGGGAGSRVRKADLLCVVDSHADVLKISGRFLQYYREQAKYLERTYDFVERLGISALQRILIDDVEGIAARLDEAMQASIDTYVDPWREADEPAHPTQFSSLIPVSRLKRAVGGE
jgi:nitrite reductase (NADH) large subunit